jgi:signal peptidase I
METDLLEGDRVLVNKSAYGVRMPITLLSIPLTFDTFFGVKSYSDFIQLNYRRLFSKKADRNDIVLFNNPLESSKPVDKRSLLVSRCVGLPGDTVFLKGRDYFVCGKKYLPSPDLLLTYRFPKEYKTQVLSILELFNIPVRNELYDKSFAYLSLDKYEVFIINQRLSVCQLEEDTRSAVVHALIVPQKNVTVHFNVFNAPFYAKIIEEELKDVHAKVRVEKGNVHINDIVFSSYKFNSDYYWLMSDNVEESIDSKLLGLVSEKYLVGEVFFIWYSSDEDGIEWSRLFSSVN